MHGKVVVYAAICKQGFSIKDAYHQLDGIKVKLQKVRSNTYNVDIFNLATVPPSTKYPTPIILDVMKLQDIKTLLPYCPIHHKPFWNALISEQEGLIDVPYVNDHDPNDDLLDYC